MPNPLIECIPNFSEARRPEVIEAILNTIHSVAGVRVLDRHSDLDHNRTVITYLGAPADVEEAAFLAIAKAAELIDLNVHSGAHPRIGATDVVPFVPLSDVNMLECIEMARRLGKRVATELNIPVYLYEEAATRPDRQNLENIRSGQFEGLKDEIISNSSRKPDFGPSLLGPAGATVIGARQPLIAFNIYLTTSDISIAQKIAKIVRSSSGGLHYVKAMGVLVDGRAQVSMNLTNYRQSSIAHVVEMVRREAVHFGVAIHHSELVGLIPQEALVNTAQWYLQLDDLQSEQILENRLFNILTHKPLEPAPKIVPTFLDQLAAGTAAPGGGYASAIAGASAAALAAMVARLTIGKKKYAAVEPQMWEILETAESLRAELTKAADQDSAAFEALMTAMHLPKNTPEEITIREAAVEQATLKAAEVPLEVAIKSTAVMELAVRIAELGNVNAISDAATSAALSMAALTGAGWNVRINTAGLKNPTAGETLTNQLVPLEEKAVQYQLAVRAHLAERAGLKA
jgi:glutamate formiminotransferase / formiminotetrahydrofolate cyclodeaminase